MSTFNNYPLTTDSETYSDCDDQDQFNNNSPSGTDYSTPTSVITNNEASNGSSDMMANEEGTTRNYENFQDVKYGLSLDNLNINVLIANI